MSVQSPNKLLVSVATYNEAENIESLLGSIRQYVKNADILVVDDGSPDGTGQIVDRLAKTDPKIRVIHRTGKLGLGTAMLRAIEHAISNQYDLLLTMDADFSHHPSYIPAILGGMKNKDVMIGSRYVPGGSVRNWPFTRKMMSHGVNLFARGMFGLRAKDTSGAFRCYRVPMLACAGLKRMESLGYSFLEELLHRCNQVGARIGETPIIFENRRNGTSKVNFVEAFRSLGILMRLGLHTLITKRVACKKNWHLEPIRNVAEKRRAA